MSRDHVFGDKTNTASPAIRRLRGRRVGGEGTEGRRTEGGREGGRERLKGTDGETASESKGRSSSRHTHAHYTTHQLLLNNVNAQAETGGSAGQETGCQARTLLST